MLQLINCFCNKFVFRKSSSWKFFLRQIIRFFLRREDVDTDKGYARAYDHDTKIHNLKYKT